QTIARRFCVTVGFSPRRPLSALRGRIFAASTMEHDTGPATQCTRGNFPGILGWRVGHRVGGSDWWCEWWCLLDEGARERCAGSESRRVVRSNADQGHGTRWRLGPENHRRRAAAEPRLGARRRAANAATEQAPCFIATLITQ